MKTEQGRTRLPLRQLLADFESGSRPKGGVGGILTGIPSLGGEHLNRDGGFKFEKIKFVPRAFAKAMTHGHLKSGDVLVVKDGATTGKVSLVRSDFPYQDAVINEHVFRLQLKKEYQPAYVFYFLYSQIGQQQILSDFRGAAQGGISQGFVDKVFVPVVTLDEQQKIVEEVEKQFTRLEAGIVALKRVQANLKRYRAAVLKAACEGKLVPTEAELAKKERRKYENGDELLERILKERRKNWNGRGKYKDPLAADNANLSQLPQGWTWGTLDSLIREPLRNGHSAKATGTGSGLRVFTLSAVTEGDFSERNTKLSVATQEKVADLWAEPGDIYVERSNTPELVGIARLYKGEAHFAFIPDLFIRVRVQSPISVRYVELCLLSEQGRNFFRARAQGISGTMPNIDQETVELAPIPLPPLAEQIRIVAEVERRLSVVEELEAAVKLNLDRATRLRQAILQQAFSGRLYVNN